jgi:hypothetical protein
MRWLHREVRTTVLAITLALTLLAPNGAQAQTREYVVEPGDSCWSIAERVLGAGEQYEIIHKHNNLGPLPHVLEPGTRLRLPGKEVRPDAEVNWTRKDVQTKAPRAVDWRSASAGMSLWQLYKVATAKESSAGIVFADQSHLRMRENALLLIHGRSARSGRLMKTEVTLERGTLRGGLERLDAAGAKAKTLRIKTPSSEIQLTGTEAQVEVTPQKTAVVAVYDGAAHVSAQGKRVEVPADFGTLVQLKTIPLPPIPLPKPPVWSSPGNIIALAPTPILGRFRVQWKMHRRAVRYRIEVSRDPKFRRVIHDVVFPAVTREAEVQDLEPGLYYTRISAIDKLRLESRPGPAREVLVVRPTGSRRLVVGLDGMLETVGLLALDFTGSPDVGNRTLLRAVGDGEFGSDTGPLTLEPGVHTIKLRYPDGAEATMTVRVLAVHPQLKLNERVTPGELVRVELTLADERGRPALLPGTTVRLLTLGTVELRLLAPGRYSGQIRIGDTHPGGAVDAQVRWSGGELLRKTIVVERSDDIRGAPTEIFRFSAQPPLTDGSHVGPGGARFIEGVTAVALTSTAFEANGSTLLRMALRGTIATRRFVADIDFPWLIFDPTNDSAISSDIGNLRLGFRYLIWRNLDFSLAPSLRLTLPTGDPTLTGLQPTTRQTGVEPGVLFEWQPKRDWLVSTNQVISVFTDFDSQNAVDYAGTYAVALRLFEFMEVAVEVDAIISLDGSPHRFVAGGSVAFLMNHFRLGLFGSGALTEASATQMGEWSAGLSLDLGICATVVACTRSPSQP